MRLVHFGLLLMLSAIWGASFLFIKVGMAEMGPMMFATLRVLVGSLVLLAIVLVRREKVPSDWRTWARFTFMGVFNALIPFYTIAWGTRQIPSGLSSILNATMPLFTVVMAALWASERLTFGRAAGVLVGFGGILVLAWPQVQGGVQADLLGQLAVVVGALSYAIATVYARRKLVGHPPLVASLGQISTGFLVCVPFALAEGAPTQVPSIKVILSLLALGVLGTAVAYLIYYRLVREAGATFASAVTYINPLFGIFWGWLLLGERLPWIAFAALALIFAGLLLINGRGFLVSLTHRRRPVAQAAGEGGVLERPKPS
ncbi:MAG: DMT family transporter [Anaerolineae bacterium]